ncbi:ABC transporter permease [Actinomadura luteofluorescens]|uniref:ABC transporter permease n=1 Tax=Actinomadura luteofluorescens TaxID=46163 RepID=UPI003632C8F1
MRPARLGAGDVLRVGLGGLRARPARVVLSALGIAIGIATVVAVIGISSSGREDLLRRLDRLGTNLLTAEPGDTLFGDGAELPETAPEMVRRIGPVTAVGATGSVEATVRRTDRIPEEVTQGIAVQAATDGLLGTLDVGTASGRRLDAATEGRPVVVLGAEAARRLGLDRAGGQVWIGGRWFVVLGVLRPRSWPRRSTAPPSSAGTPRAGTSASTGTPRGSTSAPPTPRSATSGTSSPGR